MCFAGMLAAVAAAAGDVGPSSTESATDARTLLLCEAYVRFCAATLGKTWPPTGQRPPKRATSAGVIGCGGTALPEAPPSCVADTSFESVRSDVASAWLIYGHWLALSTSRELPPATAEYWRTRARSLGAGVLFRKGHNARDCARVDRITGSILCQTSFGVVCWDPLYLAADSYSLFGLPCDLYPLGRISVQGFLRRALCHMAFFRCA